ncbi:Uncharacterised protein [uncultured archaeon]|nr:Uncharacterised protein [uncultured archaeon]
MAKTLIIGGLLVLIIALLLYIAVKPTPTQTIPVQQPIQPEDRGTPTPTAQEPTREPPTPKAEETTPPPGGVSIEAVYPQQVNFWVNEILVSDVTDYQTGFIPIKKSNIKTFAGSFGPYYADPTPHLKVILCSEFYKMAAAPACEAVQMFYKDNYVTFAKGYQYDEYIGGLAAKDYIAYYDVYAGEVKVGSSNKAVIRTVTD